MMLLMLRFVLLYITALSYWTPAAAEVHCDKQAIARSWHVCQHSYFPDETLVNVMPTDICDNIECFLQCVEDAVGDCLKTDIFLDQILDYDYQKWKIHYRYVCSNSKLGGRVFLGSSSCSAIDTCHDADTTNIKDILDDLYTDAKYTDYRNVLCSLNKKGRSCMTVMQSDNCSSVEAQYFKDVILIGMSNSICDNSDISDLYTKYGGEHRCSHPRLNSKCLMSRLVTEVSKCPMLQLQDNDNKLALSMSQFCHRIECNVQCAEDIIQDCYKQDENLIFDTSVIKVSSRAACANQQAFVSAVQNCKTMTSECETMHSTAMAEAYYYLEHQNYTAYRTTICRASSTLLDCLDYTVDENCTAKMADVLKDIYSVKLSYAKCGAQSHEMFTRYSSDTKCQTSGSQFKRVSHLLTLLLSLSLLFSYYL